MFIPTKNFHFAVKKLKDRKLGLFSSRISPQYLVLDQDANAHISIYKLKNIFGKEGCRSWKHAYKMVFVYTRYSCKIF